MRNTASARTGFSEVMEHIRSKGAHLAGVALWLCPACVVKLLRDKAAQRLEEAPDRKGRQLVALLDRALDHEPGTRAGREYWYRRYLAKWRSIGRLEDGGSSEFLDCWMEPLPERFDDWDLEDEARRRAEAAYVEHLEDLLYGFDEPDRNENWTAPEKPWMDAPASPEFIRRTLWIWVGLCHFQEPLSEEGRAAVVRLLRRIWPDYENERVTRGLLEEWEGYARTSKYRKLCQQAYGVPFGRRD